MSGSIRLGASELSVGERESVVAIPISRTGDTSRAVNIEFRIDAETATAGADFQAATGVVLTARIPAGATGVTVPVTILNDGAAEATETFVISLVNVDSGTVLSPRTARISILDDENPVQPPPSPPLVSAYAVSLETVIRGVNEPIDLEFSPLDPGIGYVASKAGQVYAYDFSTGARLSTVLDISGKVNNYQDRGLLSVELHPDFQNNPYLYAFYVVDPPESAGQTGNAGLDGGGNRYSYLSRFTVDASRDHLSIVPGSEVVLVGGAADSLSDISGGGAIDSTSNTTLRASDINPATGAFIPNFLKIDSRSHAGGGMAFGPDGKLYIGIGDGTSYNFADPRSISVQNLDSLAGKVLRIDPLTGAGLADNPFYEPGDSLASNSAKVYQLGLRNPFRATFDEFDRLIISETGWSTYEEINTGGPGANFGWPYFEGGDGGTVLRSNQYASVLPNSAAFYAAVANGSIPITAAFRAFHHQDSQPGYQFNSIVGSEALIGGARYPAALQNHYLFTDFNDGEVFSVDVNQREDIAYLYTASSGFGPAQFANGPDGYVYGVDLIGGTINRLLITERPEPPAGILFRWAAGGTAVAAIDGGPAWGASTAFVKGGPTQTFAGGITRLDASVPGTTPLALFARERWDPATGAEMGLDFGTGLAAGTYAVRLFMGNGADFTLAPGSRVFDVLIEGGLAFDDVDLSARFGHKAGGMLEWQGFVGDGTIDIDFRHMVENPLINGVEILRIADAPTLPQVNLAVSPGTASEAAGTQLTLTVTASAPVSGAQTVALGLAGTGVTAADFVGTLPPTLTIASGATSASVTLRVADDALVEGLETARFTLSSPSSGVRLGATTTATVAIADNDAGPVAPEILFRWAAGGTAVAAIDGGPAWGASTAFVKGGPTQTFAGGITRLDASVPATTPLALFARERWDPATGAEMGLDFGTGLAAGTYAVRLFMGNGADFTLAPGSRVFDVLIEGGLAFDDVDLSARFGHKTGGMLEWQGFVGDGTIDIDFRHMVENPLINGVEILRIADAPTLPQVNLAVTPGTGSEAAGTQLTLTVTASAPVSGAQTVALGLAGTGVTAADFVGTLPPTLTIASGATSASVTLRVADDALVEGLETARFTLSSPSSGVRLGATTTATVAIADNDAGPVAPEILFRWAAGGTAVAAIDGGPAWGASTAFVKGGPTQTFAGGITRLDASVPATTPLALFARERWDPATGAEMGLDFGTGLTAGTYAVRLFMGNGADFTLAPGSRVFDVLIEGGLAFDDVDLSARFGHKTGGMLEWQGFVGDGTIDIDFRHMVENPLINGVEILLLSDTLM